MTGVALPFASLGLDIDDSKQALRKTIRARRATRPRKEQAAQAAALAEQIGQVCAQASCVCLYVSVEHEPDTRLALEALRERGVEVLVPVLGPRLSRTWGRYQGGADLEIRSPGRPPEPSGPVLAAEEISRCEVIVVPALAVGADGRRLGQGGGWYDRVLAHRSPSARVLAAVFDDEVYPAGVIPVEGHDVPIHDILTPTRLVPLAN
ncbi:5-formyltetrahydrofolate cyclo-ligase [Buchananella hordeovulneris]|uniref:5-formyltetrahydrofolate cyclo-ligase n=1 Tax=Buchananella hordeovulneris TaxID=52770 RepID=A0A1Q5PVL7_9ACTO|nr:5-formyltetrahydrofolate cyclo-ligase [Buchananella hordeovulneris]OKL51460.1 5-formyltetrahydrofolate cyclo-ligase [Buchananella hordeovulneris]RRD44275.1 5-formyltetrahydrofolate cyclo-ligase [Buchananella hordeovulneris]RRD53305.1 5-formyltetrahydrofolate cyclo-ligase [Buchananella hordeovulneris]